MLSTKVHRALLFQSHAGTKGLQRGCRAMEEQKDALRLRLSEPFRIALLSSLWLFTSHPIRNEMGKTQVNCQTNILFPKQLDGANPKVSCLYKYKLECLCLHTPLMDV